MQNIIIKLILLWHLIFIGGAEMEEPLKHDQVCQCDKLSANKFLEESKLMDRCMEHCMKVAERNSGNKSELKNEWNEKNQGRTDSSQCIHEGKMYKLGMTWRNQCNELSCKTNGTLLVRKLGCKQVCLLRRDKKLPCCPVCEKKIKCTSEEMSIVILKPKLKTNDVEKLTLSDSKCKPMINETHFTFQSRLGRCGMKFRKTKNGFVYTNTVQISYVHNIIVRPLFRFSCFYKVKDDAKRFKGSFKVSPNRPVTIGMAYTDEYGNILKDSPTNKQVIEGREVFVKISANERLSNDQYLVVERCEIMSLNRRKKYALLNYGCPVDSTVKILMKMPDIIWLSFRAKVFAKGGSEYKDWFRFNSKRFHENDREYVDLSCQAAICTTKTVIGICNRKCSR